MLRLKYHCEYDGLLSKNSSGKLFKEEIFTLVKFLHTGKKLSISSYTIGVYKVSIATL